MSPLQIILVLVAGGLAGIDLASVPQAMIARPLVSLELAPRFGAYTPIVALSSSVTMPAAWAKADGNCAIGSRVGRPFGASGSGLYSKTGGSS